MRRRNHFIQREQRMIRRRRLLLKNIQRCADNDSLFDRREQSILVNQAATRAVDDPHAALHLLEGLSVDDSARLRRQRGVNRDEIRAGEEFVERGKLKLKVARLFGRDERIEGNDVHAEGACAAGDDSPDAPEADDAQRLALKLYADETLSLPTPFAQAAVGL